MSDATQTNGMRKFLIIWLGQFVSLIGSGLSAFALSVWLYQENGLATQLALVSFFYTVPGIIAAPLAGAFVDRWDRRTTLIVSDVLVGISTLCLALLFYSNLLQAWHIYVALSIDSVLNVFRWPALSASIQLIVPKQHLGRTTGMTQFSEAASQLVAPVLGAALYVSIGISGVLLIDGITFFVSMITLLLVHIPKPEITAAGKAGKGSLWRESIYGWTYLTSFPGLRALLIYTFLIRFVPPLVNVLAMPLILSFGSVESLGLLRSLGGVGAVIGSVLMSVWGGTKRRTYSMFGAEFIGGLCILLAGFSQSLILLGIVIFIYFIRWPIGFGSSYAIWLSKIPSDVQGRVLSVVRLVGYSSLPLAYLLGGPVVDYGFEPFFAADGPLAGTLFGQQFGLGPGRGIAFLFVVVGAFTMIVTAGGFFYRRLRLLEDEVPDAVRSEKPASSTQTSEGGLAPQPQLIAEGGEAAA